MLCERMKLAVELAFEQYQVPWLLSAATDWSFGEGARNSHFAGYCRLFEQVGVPPDTVRMMQRGINGYVQAGLELADIQVEQRDERGPGGKRPDFVVRLKDTGQTAFIETKMTYECTLANKH